MSKTSLLTPLLAISLTACPVEPIGTDGTSGGENGACRADFGTSVEAQRVEAFLLASGEFAGSAQRLGQSLTDGCKSIGRELGLSDADMSAAGEPPVRAACRPVAERIRSELQALRAEAQLEIQIVAVPPRCELDVDAYAGCYAECDVSYQPGEVDLQCEGGYIVGQCSAECTGQCAVDVHGECHGECQGTCSGGCTGVCQGACEGTCATTAADGSCNGRCNGTCRGSCSAGCTGSCDGQCWVEGQASCSGDCRGGCSVDYQEPRCTGRVVPPEVDASCQASCDARLRAELTCQRGEVYVTVNGNVAPEHRERVERLRNALTATWPALLETGARVRELGEASGRMIETGREMRGMVRRVGAEAVACVAAAYLQLPTVSAEITISIEVSASLTASTGG